MDEASIEAIIRKAGYKLCYVPDAIVRNKGPENIRDFLKQRRRIAAGHKHLMIEERYEVSTMDPEKHSEDSPSGTCLGFQKHALDARSNNA